MTFMKTVLILALALFIQQSGCYSQWSQTNGPYGDIPVLAIVEHDSLIMVSTDCGYFSKSQLSANWMLNGISGFSCYTKKGDQLYVSNTNSGVLRIDLTHPDSPPAGISSFAPNALAHSDSCLYMGSSMSGFSKSVDEGISWIQYNNGLPADTVWGPSGQVYFHPVITIEVTANYIFCGTNKGIYRSTGQLTPWTGINSGLPLASVKLIQAFNDTLYTVIGQTLYRSVNDGANWNTLYTAPSGITSLAIQNQVIYVGTASNGIIRSVNNGGNWSSFNSGLTDLHVNALSGDGNRLLCGTDSKGVFYAQNGQWINDQPGMVCSSINAMTATGSRLISDDNDNVYSYQSNGNWNNISPIVNHDFFSHLTSGNDSVFLSVEYNTNSAPYDSPFILFSPDNGATWNSLATPVPFAGDDPYRVYYENGKLYALEDANMSYTGNLGASWINTSLNPPYCNGFNSFLVYHSVPYAAACSNGQVLRLNNNQNWIQSVTSGLPYVEPLNFASCDGALFVNLANNGMYASLDNGNTWSYANNGLPVNQNIQDFASRGSELYIVNGNGVFGTRDFGQNWFPMNQGLKNLNIWSLEILNDTLFAGTIGNGVWKLGLNDLNLGLEDSGSAAAGIQMYPNPAADYVHIESKLLNSRYRVVDLSGKEMLTGELQTNGNIAISELKNGTYLMVIESDGGTCSLKLVVNK